MANMKFIETRSFLKAVVVVIIAVTIAIPAAYMFVNPAGTGSQAYRYITAQATPPQSPDPAPEPNVNDDEEGTVIFSSGGSGSGGGGGSDDSSDDSDDPDENTNEEPFLADFHRIRPIFDGSIFVGGEELEDAELRGEAIGHKLGTIKLKLNPDGSTTQESRHMNLNFKGTYDDTHMSRPIHISFKFVSVDADSGFLEDGAIRYNGITRTDITGSYLIEDSDPSIFVGRFVWNDETHWLVGHWRG